MLKQFLFGGLAVILFASFIICLKHATATDDFPPIPEALQAQVYFMLGQHYFNADDDPAGPYDRALAKEYFQQALALDPKVDPLAWYQLGRIQFVDADFDEALASFATQVEHFGETVPNVWYMQGLTHGYKARQTDDSADWREAEAAFINYIPHAPHSPWPRVDLAWVYFSQGKYEEMKPTLEEVLELRPDHPWLLNMYGLAQLNTGEPVAAEATFTQALEGAAELTEADWGKAYPGNNPELWGNGLEEFRTIIDKNLELARSSSQ